MRRYLQRGFTDVMLESAQEIMWGLLRRWYYVILAGLLEPFDVLGRVFHTVPGVPADIAPGRYQMAFFAHGEGASPIRKSFIVDVEKNKRLVFRLA